MESRPSRHHRPSLPGPSVFDGHAGGDDPATRAEAGERLARILVRGGRDVDDDAVADRVMHLADEAGLDTLAEWWADAPVDSLAGALWRLYVLRTWVRRDPVGASREYAAGRRFSPVDEVVAGVVDPPGPDEVAELLDIVVRGVVAADLATSLDRAAAFARLAGVGRAHLCDPSVDRERTLSAARLVETARALEAAARAERAGTLV